MSRWIALAVAASVACAQPQAAQPQAAEPPAEPSRPEPLPLPPGALASVDGTTVTQAMVDTVVEARGLSMADDAGRDAALEATIDQLLMAQACRLPRFSSP